MSPFDPSTTTSTHHHHHHHHDGENPLMALVDAASILDGSINHRTRKYRYDAVSDVSFSSSSSSSDDESLPSRPITPTLSKAPLVPTVSPMSASSSRRRIDASLGLASTEVTSSSGTGSSDKKLSFADQLMATLDNEELSDILTWMPDGKAFTIVDPKRFTKEHMPRLFHIRNMSSFVRKLTRWGFSRVHEKETLNSDIFKHHDFQRGKPELCRDMKCVGRNTATPTAAMPALSPPRPATTVVAPRPVVEPAPPTLRYPRSPPPTARHSVLPQSTTATTNTNTTLESNLQTLALQRFLEQQRMSSHQLYRHPHHQSHSHHQLHHHMPSSASPSWTMHWAAAAAAAADYHHRSTTLPY